MSNDLHVRYVTLAGEIIDYTVEDYDREFEKWWFDRQMHEQGWFPTNKGRINSKSLARIEEVIDD